ncbi:phage tail tape measure protein [Thorsellia anophelis]|uniref:Phage tail tape measure protein, lambda family n=1 Tax=Thorsellia anophelis DSM 18579 TaxID=1123402 RepID=A0A1I0D8Q5_9GAMM|nr:phage tail tape measure protein [Thorsellia anophelis]SET27916.1 phage tail tape measure protein, lambda family [Thorsellia anophelis DSM 18579]
MTDIANLHLRINTKEVKDAKQALLDLDETGKNSAMTVKELGKAFAGFIIGTSLTKIVKEATMANARYRELGVTMKAIGMNAGYTSKQLLDVEGALKKTGISALESRSSIANLIQANIDLSKATGLARLAQDAAVIGGLNSSEAYSRLIYGVQTAQTDVLRTIGITVNFEEAYKKMAAQIGKTANSLTEQEKTQARVNAVMERGAMISGAYEASMSEAGKQLRSMSRYVDDLKVKMGASFMSEFTDGVSLATSAVKALEENSATVATVIKTALAVGMMSAVVWAVKFSQSRIQAANANLTLLRSEAQLAVTQAQSAKTQAIRTNLDRVANQARIQNLVNQRLAEQQAAAGTDRAAQANRNLEAARLRLVRANMQARQSEQALGQATNATAAAQARAASLSTMNRALGAIGGKAGVAIIAASALYYFYEKSKQAREEAVNLGKEMENLANSMKKVASFSIVKSNSDSFSIIEKIRNQREELDKLENDISSYEGSKATFGKLFKNDQEAQEKIIELKKQRDLVKLGLDGLVIQLKESNKSINDEMEKMKANASSLTLDSIRQISYETGALRNALKQPILDSVNEIKGLQDKIASLKLERAKIKSQNETYGEGDKFRDEKDARLEQEIIVLRQKLNDETAKHTVLVDKDKTALSILNFTQEQTITKGTQAAINLGQQAVAWRNLGSGIAYALGQMQAAMNVSLADSMGPPESVTAELARLQKELEITKIVDKEKRTLASYKQDYLEKEGFNEESATQAAQTRLKIDKQNELNSEREKGSKGGGGAKDDSGIRALLDSKERLRTLTEQLRASEKLTAEEKRLAEFEERILLIKGKAQTADDLALLAQESLIRSSLQEEAIIAKMVNGKQAYLDISKQISLEQRNQEENLKQQLATLTMSSKQAAQYAREQQIKNQFTQKREEIGNAGIAGPMYAASLALQQQSAIEYSKRAYAELSEAEGSWKNGAVKAWNDYAANAMSVSTNVAQVCSGAFNGISDALTDMVMTGKADFADLAKSVIRDLSSMIVKMAMFSAIQTAFTGTAFGSFLGLPGKSSGGFTGTGNKYEPAGIVHKGEFVFTKEATQRLGVRNLYEIMNRAHGGYAQGGAVGGGMAPTVNNSHIPSMIGLGTGDIHVSVVVNNNGGNTETQSSTSGGGDNLGKVIGGVVREAIMKETKQGGIIHQVINNRIGR